jgi:hypothetical protein
MMQAPLAGYTNLIPNIDMATTSAGQRAGAMLAAIANNLREFGSSQRCARLPLFTGG